MNDVLKMGCSIGEGFSVLISASVSEYHLTHSPLGPFLIPLKREKQQRWYNFSFTEPVNCSAGGWKTAECHNS